jgi:hypothetical protein
MKKLALSLLVIASSAALFAADNELAATEKADGWKLLFDGKTAAGWRGYKQKTFPAKGWKIENGVLQKIAGERGGDIVTEKTFGDYEFAWEWKLAPGGNNGVKYLVTEDRAGAPGHEYQMIDDGKHPDAKGAGTHLTAAFYDVLPTAANKPLKPAGDWNQSRLIVRGNHIEHWLNGQKVLEYELGSEVVKAALAKSKFKNAKGFGDKISGHIMLTDHGDGCAFRNLKLRELAAK